MIIRKASTGLIFVLVLLFCSSIRAGVLSLDDCIELALQNRYSIISARGDEAIAGAGKRSALGAFLPRLSASYNYSKSKSSDIKSESILPDYKGVYSADYEFTDIRTGQLDTVYNQLRDSVIYSKRTQELDDQDRTSKALSFSASLSILNPVDIFSYTAACTRKSISRLDVISSEQDLIYSVKTSYYAYLAAEKNVEVQADAVKRSEEQLKLIQSKYELGSASLSDVLKQKVQYGNDKLTLLSAKHSVVTARASLAYAIGIELTDDISFSTDYRQREYTGSLQDAMKFGMEHQPVLLAAQKNIEYTGRGLWSARSSYLPYLTAYADLTYSDGTRGDTVTFDFSDRSSTYGFRLNWNIFDGFSREESVTRAKISRNNANAYLADTRNLTSKNIKTAYLDIERLKEQRKVSEETVDAANEDLKITQEKYNLGAATILDLLDAQVSLKEAQVSLIRANFDLNLAEANLEKSMGKM